MSIADLFMLAQAPADQPQYTGSAFSPGTGDPSVNPHDRNDFLEGTPGSNAYTPRPGVPNYLPPIGDAIQATDREWTGNPVGAGQGAEGVDSGWMTPIGSTWYDSERQNAGFPLPVPADHADASQFDTANDFAAIAANVDYPTDAYTRFGQPDLNPNNCRITERSFDFPVDWKKNPTFPAQIQEPRPWDKYLGAWPWKGTKDAISQPVTSLPNYYPMPIDGGVPYAGGTQATVPNTPSLQPQPMTFRVMPEQWDTDFVYSGL